MNSKQAKKIRQLYRKDFRKIALEQGKIIGNIMRPKPKFVPWFIWMFLVRLVIKTKR